MSGERDFSELTEHLEKAAEAVGLSDDREKSAFFHEMLKEREFGLAFDTLEDFVGEQEAEDMVSVAAFLARLRSLMQVPRR